MSQVDDGWEPGHPWYWKENGAFVNLARIRQMAESKQSHIDDYCGSNMKIRNLDDWEREHAIVMAHLRKDYRLFRRISTSYIFFDEPKRSWQTDDDHFMNWCTACSLKCAHCHYYICQLMYLDKVLNTPLNLKIKNPIVDQAQLALF